MAQPPHDLDALREKLRALGYLDAGVDRFVLGPARAGRSLAAIASRASVRVGVLAGLLLGISGGLAAGARIPGLVTGLRDSIVLTAMLATAFGIAACLATFLAIWLTARALRALGPRRASRMRFRPFARAAGVSVGAASLAYLTLWWGATAGSAASGMPIASAIAVLVALMISVLLGHATTTTIEAVLAAEYPKAALPRHRLSLRASVAIAVIGASASAGWLATTTPPSSDPLVSGPPVTVVPTGLTLTVVAIDGFDPDVFDGLGLAAEAPHLARLRHGRPVRFTAIEPGGRVDPVRQWTTVSTGLAPRQHGVSGMEVRRVRGLGGVVAAEGRTWIDTVVAATDLLQLTRPSVGVGLTRTAPTFWEVAARAGLRTVAANWWASWPATDRDGVVLTERAALRVERGGRLDHEIAPESIYEALRPRWPALAAGADALVGRRFGTARDPALEAVRVAASVDAVQVALTRAVVTGREDLIAVYLPGLDIASEALFGRASSPETTLGPAMAPGELSRRLQALRPLYLLVEDLVATLDMEGRTLVLLSSRGRLRAADTGALVMGPPPAAMASAGPEEIADVDLAPTLLHALGIPVSEQLPGRVRLGLLPPAAAAAAVRRVASYPDRSAGTGRQAAAESLEQEMRERLRSLGYVR